MKDTEEFIESTSTDWAPTASTISTGNNGATERYKGCYKIVLISFLFALQTFFERGNGILMVCTLPLPTHLPQY